MLTKGKEWESTRAGDEWEMEKKNPSQACGKVVRAHRQMTTTDGHGRRGRE